MTDEEFTAKYRDVVLSFSSYYKYSFTSRGIAPDGVVITAVYGGQDDIYKYEVSHDSKQELGCVDEWMHISAILNDEIIYNYSGW